MYAVREPASRDGEHTSELSAAQYADR